LIFYDDKNIIKSVRKFNTKGEIFMKQRVKGFIKNKGGLIKIPKEVEETSPGDRLFLKGGEPP
jgi:hypothetical protein